MSADAGCEPGRRPMSPGGAVVAAVAPATGLAIITVQKGRNEVPAGTRPEGV